MSNENPIITAAQKSLADELVEAKVKIMRRVIQKTRHLEKEFAALDDIRAKIITATDFEDLPFVSVNLQ